MFLLFAKLSEFCQGVRRTLPVFNTEKERGERERERERVLEWIILRDTVVANKYWWKTNVSNHHCLGRETHRHIVYDLSVSAAGEEVIQIICDQKNVDRISPFELLYSCYLIENTLHCSHSITIVQYIPTIDTFCTWTSQLRIYHCPITVFVNLIFLWKFQESSKLILFALWQSLFFQFIHVCCMDKLRVDFKKKQQIPSKSILKRRGNVFE